MKTMWFGKLAIIAAMLAFFCVSGSAFAGDNSGKDQTGKFTQGTKGHALDALEQSAGKKIQDVKVPEPPKPTPVTGTTGTRGR
jgi:hypothetical protein